MEKKTFKYKYWVLKSIIESWQAITVMVWLLYYLDLIMHSASFVCLSYAHIESLIGEKSALFVVFGGLCSSSSKNDHFRSNFKSTIGGSAKHQIEFQKKYTYSRPRGDFGTFYSTQQLKLK